MGFLGRYIIPLLVEQGANVTGIDTRDGFAKGNLKVMDGKVRLVESDITNFSSLQKVEGDFDYIIHLAAIAAPRLCEENPSIAFDSNVHGTFNMLKYALRHHVKKVVFASTAHVYGISPKYMPTDERHPLALQDIYTTTKIMGESLCQLYYGNHNLAYITIRLFNSYGPGQSLDYFIPAMIAQAKTGHVLLHGREITKDFVYVEDVADAYVKALSSNYVGEINIGSGKQTSLETVARYIASSYGAELKFAETQSPGPTHMQSDISRARTILGWTPKTSLEDGLDKTIQSSRLLESLQ